MTDEQWRAFVTHGTRTGKLATVRADGRPHVVPVWFALDGDELVFQSEKAAVKARNLARDPRFALTVDDDRPPYAFVAIQGHATMSDEPDEVRYWAGRLGARYIGEDRAEEYAARNGGPGIVVVRGSIDRVHAIDGIAD
ncbi:PPOX class F420-dependent oxidoreductase [Mycolicibacterium llatzerense]|uniref:PPOX class F420-dependent oxidoreductase n=1 Tax=Mycolicibacterium llatzerense TaxID=280871 RepID=UPI0023EEE39D|nr:PPOX class F420-dependent oxidoreductase [Mycolicibacterium llatzerense]MCT7362902.1 PPOX class F420-dependent enzyme [Mycolicibacterium llatzerense]